MRKDTRIDITAALEKDPAAKSRAEVYFTYGGIRALDAYRRAHALYKKGRTFRARLVSERAKRKTGIDIHPAAVIGKGVFIDHGVGVVIGETAVVGDNVTIYQGVTLGGTGKHTGKRHPTIEDDVMISAGAKILGPITIGKGSKIGAGSVVLKDVPAGCTVVGVPGRIVRINGERIPLDQSLPDPVIEEFERLNRRIAALEEKAGIKACKYSITMDNLPPEEYTI